ncbi:MAG: Acetoin:2,6-dichlorophenolindophenol oxidoreductase subunit beta [Verrucomicrobiae bacterium]|nr:Acetoin:2,6-dichlorophenolindophenol oxidoreductase subunit beta [Verrucomicrobiae bacterium]
MSRLLTYAQALNEAVSLTMEVDPAVFIIGEGVDDPKGIFGSTSGLKEKFGDRASDMPLSENGMTGVIIGAALAGMRPVMTHQRIDFTLLALDQIVNHAAKRCYTSGGRQGVPITIRCIIGRGWGQGSQHSQSLHSFFAHIPGLKVVMPTTPYDAKGLLIASIEDNNPVVFIEHRWLYNINGQVPEGLYRVPIGEAKMVREGSDLTIAAVSYMTLEALRAADMLAEAGVSVEVVDVRTLRPLDDKPIINSARKTGRLLVADTGWKAAGFSAEIVARVVEELHGLLKCAPRRIALPDCPTPTTPALANNYYPRSVDLVAAVCDMLGMKPDRPFAQATTAVPLDLPDKLFTGPF